MHAALKKVFSKTAQRVRRCQQRTTCEAPITAAGEVRVTGQRSETSGEAAFAAPLVRSETSRSAVGVEHRSER